MTVKDLVNELLKLDANAPVALLGPRDQLGPQEEFEPEIKQSAEGGCLLVTGKIL